MSEGKRQAHGKKKTHGPPKVHGQQKPHEKPGAHERRMSRGKQKADSEHKADHEPKAGEEQKSEELEKLQVPPDRLSIDPTNRFYREELVERGIGIRFRGKVRTNVHEYCISEGWVKMTVGKTVDRHGHPLMVKTNGPVEAWFEDLGEDPPVASVDATD